MAASGAEAQQARETEIRLIVWGLSGPDEWDGFEDRMIDGQRLPFSFIQFESVSTPFPLRLAFLDVQTAQPQNTLDQVDKSTFMMVKSDCEWTWIVSFEWS